MLPRSSQLNTRANTIIHTKKSRWLYEHLYVSIPDTLAMIWNKFFQYIEAKVTDQPWLKSNDKLHTIFFPWGKYFSGFIILGLLLDFLCVQQWLKESRNSRNICWMDIGYKWLHDNVLLLSVKSFSTSLFFYSNSWVLWEQELVCLVHCCIFIAYNSDWQLVYA